ncbi:sensor histidine kinase, partial [Streptomyces oceani]|uniref:sensor histidine kinase n=1 Tax=Streptomyces oceani TaxID=1075402 RepID=UPI0008722AE3
MTETGERARAQDHAAGGREPDLAGPWWWLRTRSFVLDVTLAVLSGAECAFRSVSFAHETGMPVPLAVALGALVGLVLVLRRRWPIVVVLLSIAILPTEMGYLLSIVGLYTLAASDVPRRITSLLTGMQILGTLVITFVRLQEGIGQAPDFDPQWWFLPLITVLMSVGLTVPPVLTGLYVGARRRWVESIRDRADGLERELSLLADRAEERAEWARNEERTRIAREMHDVVAHRVSLMVVHAAALQTVALKDPEKAAKNAALVGDMGRHALTELRTMLGVLRTAEPGTESADGGTASSAQTPGGDRAGGSSATGAGTTAPADSGASADTAVEPAAGS